MTDQPSTEKSIFLAALEKGSAQERAAYLDEVCRDDPRLRGEVEALLAAHERLASIYPPAPAADLPSPPWGRGVGGEGVRPTIDDPITERPGTVIGPYKLLEQIGEGGFGVVFMAEQTQPVRRKVALKVLKPGMDTRQVVARFEAERQALAIMDHPNIAKVHDGGATPSGRPYFVMELVKGVPITDFCDQNHLTPKQRLELFVSVCQAVQHAHQKGIIHRDLKPSNVLVSRHDATPVVKVIDFGVAKALGQELTDKTLFTGLAQMIGTPLYMSPEQAGMSDLDVDTRSDIYSLGVLLYELLTGTTPFDRERFKKAAYDEIRRILREEEPPKPSTKLSTSQELPSVAANRGSEPKKLSRLVKGELDWIVMKALEKDRNRRYETANGFAMDVQRYLADEPVLACPPSVGYRLRKFVRRNKGPVAAGAALAALLVLGTLGTSIGLVWALQAERTATLAAQAEARQRIDAEMQRDRAKSAEQVAKEQADIAKAVNNFIQNDLLAEAAPEKNARAKKVTVEEVLGRAAARIAGKFDKQPRIEAAIRQTIGRTYHSLGDYEAAQSHLERSLELYRRLLGEEHADTLAAMSNLALLYLSEGRSAKAESLLVKVLDTRRRLLGDEHRDVLDSMSSLAGAYQSLGQFVKAESLFAKVLEVRQRVLGEPHVETLAAMDNLAVLHCVQGQHAQAASLGAKALEGFRRALGEEHHKTLTCMDNLAGAYQYLRQYAKAEPLHVKALKGYLRIFGEEHPKTLIVMNNLAAAYHFQGKYDKAEPLYVKALEVSSRVVGEGHPDTIGLMNNLAAVYEAQRRFSKAEPLYVKALDLRRQSQGEEHPNALHAMNNLAGLYTAQGQFAKAEPLLVETLEVRRRTLGEKHPDTINSIAILAALYRDQGEYAKAEPLHIQALELRRRVLGAEHPETIMSLRSLAYLYQVQVRPDKAEPLYVQALELCRRVLTNEHPDTISAMDSLAGHYAALGHYAKAEPLYVEALELSRRVLGREHPDTLGSLYNLGVNYQDQGQFAKAEPLLRECLKIREQNEPDEWTTFDTKSRLGASLMGQKKYADAEPLLLAGYEGMKQRETKMDAPSKDRLLEAIERLVQLYEAWGQPEKAAEWRKKLAAQVPGKKD